MTPDVPRPFAWLRVVEASRGIAGAYAGRLLADAGATVARITGPEGTGDATALARFLHTGKQAVQAPGTADLLAQWVAGADVLVEDLGPDALPVAELRARVPSLTVVSVSSFGASGPWAHRPANEFTLQALCGSTIARGLPERGPVQAGGRLGEWTAGGYAAAVALACARRARAGGQGEHVDLSVLEAMLLTQNTFGHLFRALGAPKGNGPARFTETPSVVATKDGHAGFCTVTAQQFQDFLVLIERPDLLLDDELATAVGRRRRRDEFDAAVHAWTSVRTTDEVVEAAEALRIPCVPVTTPETVLQVPHFRERGMFVRNPHGFEQPRVPYRIDGVPDVQVGPVMDVPAPAPVWPARTPGGDGHGRDALPLDGLRVVDLTAFWAGPSATQLLAVLGAEVVKVESTVRPDMMRFTTARRGADRWWEYGPVFHGANTGKLGVTLDLTTDQGRDVLRRLVERADLVVENFTPRVLGQLGIPPAVLHAWNPQAVVVRMPAFGLDGPWRDRPGFAQTMEQVGSIASLTGEPDLPPMLHKSADPIAGVHAVVAALAGLEQRERIGRGGVVEVPMIETVLNVAAEAIVEYSATGRLATRTGNRSEHAAPQGVYACAGEENWIALSVETDAQWQALRDHLDHVALPELPTLAERVAAHDTLDAALGTWFATRDLHEAAAELAALGMPVAPLVDQADAVFQEQSLHRAFLERLDHPVAGQLDMPGPPFRFASRGSRPWLTTPAPRLGRDNDHVLRELLALSDGEITALRDAGVVGETLRG